MGAADAMEQIVALLDLAVDPGFVALGAAAQDGGEGPVAGDGEERIFFRSERERRNPSSGMIARLRGSTQKMSGASRLSAIGKTPIA